MPGEPEWLEQLWFAGNHSDIGGSYAEEESRLSDISLKWMLEAAVAAEMKCDGAVLKLYPDPEGPQHDETRAGIFRFAGKQPRKVAPDAPLHDSVLKRFAAIKVQQYEIEQQYRPTHLSEHQDVKKYYS